MDRALLSLSNGWLWPVLRRDWHNSIFGITAIKNIIWIHLFDKLMASLPHQELGLYLCENQGWERVFTRAWRRHRHGKLIGVAHSTISYWDMRYFNQADELIDIPQPDTVAVNGPNAWETLKAAGQPMDQYVKVEALRYLYLSEFSKDINLGNTLNDPYKSLRLIVLGDIRSETTHRMLLVIEQAFKDIKGSYEIRIKPHVANPVALCQYPLLRAEIVEEDLNDLLPQADLVLTSVFTSAGLDAFCSGTRVICYLDPYDLNYSLLRGVDGVEFISSSRDLFQALKQDRCISNNLFKPENFFWLNPELPLWKALLGLDQKHITENIR
jgi:surface carbohydrate biosynthesis protein (TIGR04326 family)